MPYGHRPFNSQLERYLGHGFRSVLRGARHQVLLRQLHHRLRYSSVQESTPNEVFGDLDDPSWLWINTAGYRKSRLIRGILPSLPPESTQLEFTGDSGDSTLTEGFRVYRLFKSLYQHSVGEVSAVDHILDFGCGWGRVIRFFLRDVDPSTLYGVDPLPKMIELCKQTNKWCRFLKINPMPPTSFPEGMFDLIFANSVFSHLSEDVHKDWLGEFRRLLKPGGLLVATTWPREYIESREAMLAHLPDSMKGNPPAFPSQQDYLAIYDAGEYVHSHLGHPTSPDYFGETCIPKNYVLGHWTKYLDFVDFVEDRRRCLQNVIVMRS